MQRGFTLIELVMILLLIAILAAVAIPRFSGYGAIKQGNAVMKIASDIRYAQNRATTTQQRSRVSFTGAATYEVRYCTSYTQATCSCSSWNFATDPYTRGNFQVNLNNDFSGVTIANTVSLLEFDPLGRPYNGAVSCTASVGTTVAVKYGGEPDKNIIVQSQTGMVSY
ncbi:MAG: prepilin-type N-terminal cleavage/methylation domain-containing protein [Deltaproteobacteria bacterium]|nr:prepilin-type N-terminal cleavage/methylation domain-containing protein [Deltaproteobacteria bacterium]